MSVAPVLIFIAIGYAITDVYKELMLIIKRGFRTADKSFLWMCFLLILIILTGNIAVSSFLVSVPIVLYPVMVIILGGLICLIAGFVLLICCGICMLFFYLLTNIRSFGSKYWKWLTCE